MHFIPLKTLLYSPNVFFFLFENAYNFLFFKSQLIFQEEFLDFSMSLCISVPSDAVATHPKLGRLSQ